MGKACSVTECHQAVLVYVSFRLLLQLPTFTLARARVTYSTQLAAAYQHVVVEGCITLASS